MFLDITTSSHSISTENKIRFGGQYVLSRVLPKNIRTVEVDNRTPTDSQNRFVLSGIRINRSTVEIGVFAPSPLMHEKGAEHPLEDNTLNPNIYAWVIGQKTRRGKEKTISTVTLIDQWFKWSIQPRLSEKCERVPLCLLDTFQSNL